MPYKFKRSLLFIILAVIGFIISYRLLIFDACLGLISCLMMTLLSIKSLVNDTDEHDYYD